MRASAPGIASNSFRQGPTTTQEIPNMAKRAFEDGHKAADEGPERLKDGPREHLTGPRGPTEGPSTASRDLPRRSPQTRLPSPRTSRAPRNPSGEKLQDSRTKGGRLIFPDTEARMHRGKG
eukprot:7086212-Pyramimonas_sp.AAC.1